MIVTCKNCYGQFEDSEAKCPYCDMIYVPGAEKAYMGQMEGIRQNLDKVDDIVVTDFRKNVKRFFVTFLIAFGVVLLLIGVPILIGRLNEAKERKSVPGQIRAQIQQTVEYSKAFDEWDKMFNEGRYDDVYELFCDARTEESGKNVGNWKHYDFFYTFDYFRDAIRRMDNYEANYAAKLDYTNILNDVFTVYVRIFNDSNRNLTLKDREILSGKYEELKDKMLETLDISDEDYEKIRDRLAGDGQTYVSFSDCQNIMNERIGGEN